MHLKATKSNRYWKCHNLSSSNRLEHLLWNSKRDLSSWAV